MPTPLPRFARPAKVDEQVVREITSNHLFRKMQLFILVSLVPGRRLELPRPLSHWYLKPARLPFRHPGRCRSRADIRARPVLSTPGRALRSEQATLPGAGDREGDARRLGVDEEPAPGRVE